ncbi:unnamed protein product [Pocillopora meandrina]|uniref:Uncharacterized protein n=1 Tax=Pocillopora meandrina TaxID=46732 RepID=A0AAU9VPU7_9CNID|nr:unnamed protein product [Pocillopora meandrina]
MERAEMGRSHKVPRLKYAFVYRDNWTRLNVRPAKIMQQRYMIAAIQDLAKEPNQESATLLSNSNERSNLTESRRHNTCSLIFENGLLSRRRINSLNSPVIPNTKKGMDFFEKWCRSHKETVYSDNTKKSRQKKSLAWQVSWYLLRVVINRFLSFCQ